MNELKKDKIINHYIELMFNDFEEEEIIRRLIKMFDLTFDDLSNDLSFSPKLVEKCLKLEGK